MERKKTKQMLQVEKEWGGVPLEKLVLTAYAVQGFADGARMLGVSSSTFNYWLLKFRVPRV